MKLRATLIGFTAILMWSFLALLTAASGKMPPFQLSTICFAIGSIPGLVVLILNPARLALLKQLTKVWVTGISGLFGYHFLYFTALRNAPAVEAGLVAYLWPLLIVVGSALLPGERLRWYHVAGALAGLCGTFLIVGRNGIDFDGAYAVGYGAAFLSAFTWSGYSLLTRRFDAVSTDVVTGFCLATSMLSFFCHLGLETTVWLNNEFRMGRRHRARPLSGRGGLLCLGLRRQERRHPDPRRGKLRSTAAFDAYSGAVRICRAELAHCLGLPARDRRGGAGCPGDVSP